MIPQEHACLLLWGQVRQRRVVRGGAFNNNTDNARCAYRNNNDPNNRNNNIGFRVAASTFLTSGSRCAGARESRVAEGDRNG